MKINGEDVNLEELLSKINFEKNQLIAINKDLNLTKYQINILDKHKINYQDCNSLDEVLMLGNYIYETTLDEELELVLDEIIERKRTSK